MKTISTLAVTLVTALALSAAPIASASARGWDHHGYRGGWGHHGGGWGPGPIAAVVGAAAALVAAPFLIAGSLAEPEPPPPAYYSAPAPAPVAYGYPAYYPHRTVVVSGYPPAYAYPTYAPY